MDPTYPLVPVANILCVLLVLVSFSSGIFRSWNTGVCMYAIWVCITCLIRAINCIIWSGNVNDVAPVWCDIVTRLGLGGSIGIPACSLAITRRLYKITCMRETLGTKKEKRSDLIVDLSICLGIPVLAMTLYYIVQQSRYQIFEELGCVDAEVASGLTLMIITLWNVILPTISVFFYCPRIIWVFYRRNKEFNQFLAGKSAVDRGSYFRFMALGLLDVLITLPLSILGLVVSILSTSFPFWPGWTYVHSDWLEIPQVPASDWAPEFWVNFSVKRAEWVYVVFALVFFLLFGLTGEAIASYRSAFWACVRPFGFKRKPDVKPEVTTMAFDTANVNTAMPSTSFASGRSSLESLQLSGHVDARLKVELARDIEKGDEQVSELPPLEAKEPRLHEINVESES